LKVSVRTAKVFGTLQNNRNLFSNY
jgi:hypothetical protein